VCSDCDLSVYKNVESLTTRTYIPNKSIIFSISAYMTGERGTDDQKKKINLSEEDRYFGIYDQILSTFKFTR